jgi:hypothetical protein
MAEGGTGRDGRKRSSGGVVAVFIFFEAILGFFFGAHTLGL